MANNFIEQIIEKDIETGKVSSVQTRFPPEPNGYLHIGHAKSLCINFGIADKYNGKCYIRYDDTNPTKEDEEYVKAIEQDIQWLGFKWDGIRFASDYFDMMFDCAVELINKGLAFVCDCNAEEIKLNRGSLTQPGIESPYRNRSIKENLDLFMRMKNGEFTDGEKTLRAKIDMSSPNINMRDPVIYRVLHAHHHNTKGKWCIYPMYDFAHPIEDAVEGTTHSICTLEFEDHRPFYDWVIANCGHSHHKSKPQQIEFARLNITNMIMSKRFLKSLVNSKLVMGWDDPRLPTLCGIRRRGYPAEAIKDFCNRIGVVKSNSEVEESYLQSCVRDNLNVNCDRVMGILNPLKVVLTNLDEPILCQVENNPNATEVTTRNITLSKQIYIERSDFELVPPPKYYRLKPDGYVRLKGAYIIHCDSYLTDDKGEVTQVNCSIVPNSMSGNDNSGVKVKGVIQWVDSNNCVDLKVRKFGKLLIEDNQDLTLFERFNPASMTEVHGVGERCLRDAQVGDRFQFMRTGYFVLDQDSDENLLVFNEIVPLKDSFNK
ncbi:MAG: glutamine--tRNA ligase/YqeY domain fusion protein [Clostridia bacterium]|nr:glutamine--tRNA ligase/YqeY domain fusion protein [Clostridia bacterium]